MQYAEGSSVTDVERWRGDLGKIRHVSKSASSRRLKRSVRELLRQPRVAGGKRNGIEMVVVLRRPIRRRCSILSRLYSLSQHQIPSDPAINDPFQIIRA